MTYECFTKGMAIFAATFRGVKFDINTQKIWHELLQDLSDEQFKSAISKICREVKDFYPTTNFVALVREQIKENQVDTETLAMLAWEKALTSVKHGVWASVTDPDILRAVNAIGGWIRLRHDPIDKLKFTCKEFVNAHKAFNISQANNKQEKISADSKIQSLVKSIG